MMFFYIKTQLQVGP